MRAAILLLIGTICVYSCTANEAVLKIAKAAQQESGLSDAGLDNLLVEMSKVKASDGKIGTPEERQQNYANIIASFPGPDDKSKAKAFFDAFEKLIVEAFG